MNMVESASGVGLRVARDAFMLSRGGWRNISEEDPRHETVAITPEETLAIQLF